MNGRTEPTSYFQELAQSSSAALEQALRVGVLPEETSLAGWEWNGQNTGRIPRLLGIQKFIKGFFCETEGLEGYNVVAQQNGPENPWVEKPAAPTKRRFGFYRVRPALEEPRDRRYPNALMLNYGASPRNPRASVTRVLRDYLVQPDPDNPEVLLGKAYLALGPLRLPSNYFVLARRSPAPGDQPPAAD
jgi:hypothetical protein